LQWSKDNTAIISWDSPLDPKVVVQSAMTGEVVAVHEPYQACLGVKSVQISPSGSYLCAGWFDGKARLYSNISWKELSSLEHEAAVNTQTTIVYKEDSAAGSSLSASRSVYVNVSKDSAQENSSFKVPTLKREALAFNPQTVEKNGLTAAPPTAVSLMSWSPNSQYLATRCDSSPQTCWIWDIFQL